MWVLGAVTLLAVARLTRLVTTDRIGQRPRDALARRLPAGVAYGLYCRWCASIWVAALVVPPTWYYRDSNLLLVVWAVLAASHLTGLLTRFESEA